MLTILEEKGLKSHGTLENILDAYSTLDDGIMKRIDRLASMGCTALPKPIVDYLKERVSFNTPVQTNQNPAMSIGAATGVYSDKQTSNQDPFSSSEFNRCNCTPEAQHLRPSRGGVVVADPVHIGVPRHDGLRAGTIRSLEASSKSPRLP